MKKLSLLDKISLGIIIFNFISFLSTFIFKNTLYRINNMFDMIVAVLMMYTIFGIIGTVIIGAILNIVSTIKKIRKDVGVKFNIVLFILLILNIPIWWQFFFEALMYV